MRYRCPAGKQSAAVLSFDFDAESGFLFREPEKAKRSLGALEERRFGPRVGVDRILRLLDRLRLRASFFIPGWTAVHHLPQCKLIRDAGQGIGGAGNVQEAVGMLDAAQEKAVLEEQLAILRAELGVKPAGYRSPSWDVNVWTPALLKTHGFLYDSSLMGNDVPYDVQTPAGRLRDAPEPRPPVVGREGAGTLGRRLVGRALVELQRRGIQDDAVVLEGAARGDEAARHVLAHALGIARQGIAPAAAPARLEAQEVPAPELDAVAERRGPAPPTRAPSQERSPRSPPR